LILSVSIINPVVKNCEETERSFVQGRPFSKHWKPTKYSPLDKLESALTALFKQACESNASTGGTHLKEKGLHNSAHEEMANFSASNGSIGRFKKRHDIVYSNLSSQSRSVDSGTAEDWKNYRLLQEIVGYKLCNINNADERQVYLLVYILEDTSAMMVQNLNSGLLCSSHAMKMIPINYHSRKIQTSMLLQKCQKTPYKT
jgi:hypothetical protein